MVDRPEPQLMSDYDRSNWLMKLKDCDWLFYEFDLFQVDGEGVTNGTVYHGCGITRCRTDLNVPLFPLDMRIKRISASFKWLSDEIHNIQFPGLNHPDLHQMLVGTWVAFCRGVKPRDNVGTWCREACGTIKEAVSQVREPTIHGVRIFGR